LATSSTTYQQSAISNQQSAISNQQSVPPVPALCCTAATAWTNTRSGEQQPAPMAISDLDSSHASS
jgi:hypothetical protein